MSRGASLHGIPTAPEVNQSADSTAESVTQENQGEGLVLPDRVSPQAVPVSGPAEVKAQAPDLSDGLDLPDKKSKLEGVYAQVQATDPDRAAKVLAIQQKVDMPAAFIDKNLDAAHQAASAPSGGFFKQIEDQYPGTSKFLSDPKNMAVSHDDLPNVAEHEGLIQRAENYLVSLKNVGEYGAEVSIPGLLYRQAMPDQSLEPKNPDIVQRFVQGAAGLAGDFPFMAASGVAGAYAGAPVGATVGALGGIPGIAVGGGLGATAGGAFGSFAIPTAIKGIIEQKIQSGQITSYSDILKEASKQGIIGLITAGVGGAASKVLGKTALPAAVQTVGKLGAESATMTGASAVAEGKKPTWGDLVDSTLQVGAMHGVFHILEAQSQANKTKAMSDFYTALGNTAEASKLRERLPEAHQQLVAQLTKDGPVENVYIPADAAQSYFQSKNIDPDAAMAELGVTKSFQEAKETGGDIKIPLSTWTDKIVGTEHYQGLANDIKFDPEDLTANQVQAKKSEIQAEVKNLMDEKTQAKAEADHKEATFQKIGHAGEVARRIQEQLKAAGVSQPEMEFSPQLHEAFFNTLGQHLGIEPTELMDRFPLQIGRGEDIANTGQDVQREPETSAPEAMAAQAAYKPEVLQQIRSDVESGNIENGNVTKDAEGYVTGRHGAVSTYPEYFQKKGYTKKETLRAIDKHLEGKELTEKQAKIVDDLYHSSGYDKEAVKTKAAAEPFLQNGAMDMSEEARMGRAKAMGFDTSRTLFHGTTADFDQFENKRGSNGRAYGDGTYLTSRPNEASDYANARDREGKWKSGGKVIPLLAKIENPFNLDAAADPKFVEKLQQEPGLKRMAAIKNAETNFDLYGAMINKLSSKRFTDLLKEHGYDALEAPHAKTTVVFKPENLRSKFADFNTDKSDSAKLYEQGAPKIDEASPRGRIRIGREGYAIDLFKSADKSTFLHETGHYFLDVMGRISEDDNAPANVKEDYQTILKWLGVGSRDEIGTDQHEKFARGFEQYLMEGKAPSSALQRAFNRFRKWLTSVYKHVKNLNVDMSDDVRGVMDRMLASEQEVERAQKDIGYTGEGILGLPADVQAKIHDLQTRARDEAETHLLKEQMAETTAKRKEFLASERTKIRGEAEDQVSELPLYKAMDEAVETIGTEKKAGTIAEKFLSDKMKPKDKGKFEALAEVHGFADGEELAQHMVMAEEGGTREHEIEARVEAGMSQHGDMMNGDAIRAEAISAVHGERMTELLALEREAMAKLVDKTVTGQEVSKRNRLEAKIEAAAAKAQAREILSQKPIKEATNARTYITAERNSAVKAAKALVHKDYAAASEAKRQQMLNHAIASEAMRNKVEAEKSVSFLKDFAKRRNDLKDMPYGFIRQIDQMLSDKGLAEQRPEDFQTLAAAARDMASKGDDPMEIANRTGMVQDQNGNFTPESLPDFVSRVNDNYYGLSVPDSVMSGTSREYGDLTLQELRDLKNSVKAIGDVGKKYDRFLGEFKTLDIKQAAAELRSNIENEVGTPYADSMKIGSSHSSKWGEKVQALLRLPDAVIPDMVNILTLCHFLDGGKEDGPAKEFIYRPLKHAEDQKLSRYQEMTKTVNDLFAQFYEPRELASYKEKREMQPALGRYMTKEEILSMGLNWGNEGNRDRIRKGFNLTDEQVQGVLKSLSKKDWDFAQAVWDHLDTYWPEIKALEMKINGVEPGRVESSPVETDHGTYRGGYYPIAYDFDRSADAYKNTEQKNALYKQYSAAAAHTESGHAESRVSSVKRPVRLSLDVLFGHLENVVHDLEYREPIIDVNRFLNQTDVKAALTNAIGIKGYRSFDTWLKNVASDQGEALTIGDKAFRYLRFSANFAQLGLSLKALVVHGPGNVANAIWEQGPAATISAFKDFMMNPADTKSFVDDRSDRMAQRAMTRDRDMMDMSRQLTGKESKLDYLKNQFAFITYRLVDEGVAYPLWKSTYQRAISEFGDEGKARDIADEAVTRTLGSGSVLDQVGAQRGNEFKKLTSMMFSWASMMFNRMWLSGKLAGLEYRKENLGGATAVLAKAAVYGWFAQAGAEALWQAVSNNSQSGNSDDEKKKIASGFLKQPFAYLWLGRDIAGYAIDEAMGKRGASYELSPIESAVSTIVKPIGDAAHIAFSDGHADEHFGESCAKSASMMLGYPTQLNKMTFNFLDWSQGQGELTYRDLLSRRSKR